MRSVGRTRFIVAVLLLAGCSGSSGETKRPVPPVAAPNQPDAAATAEGAKQGDREGLASKPRVPLVLTCENVSKVPNPGLCAVLEKAPRADPNHALTKRAVAVWRRIEGPVRALSGRESALVVLSPNARMGEGAQAEPLPPAAFICPGAPPTVYVPGTLLSMIGDGKGKAYPEDFLAFVIGHELAHRMHDLTPDGCQLAAFQRPGKGIHEEELADARSAFFMTNAGFSASKIARQDLVTKFLEAEFSLGRTQTKGRHDALLGALSSFDAYEALYQAGLSIALTGEMEAADRLLSWADELLESQGVLLPELRVIRAITRINRTADIAPWIGDLGLPVSIAHLRCIPLHPGHSSLWEEPFRGATGRGPAPKGARELLQEALRLLDQAEARGATGFTVAAARACASLYLSDASGATRAQSRAEELLFRSAPATVTKTLAENRALVKFLAHVKRRPAPDDEESEPFRLWVSELTAAIGRNQNPPDLVWVLEALGDLDSPGIPPSLPGPTCNNTSAPRPSPLPALPTATKNHGTCPPGFSLDHALPSVEAAKRTGSNQGITVCRPSKSAEALTTVRLIATTEPPLAALERTMRTVQPPASMRSLDTWACHCSDLSKQGVSDRGDIVYRARCPALGLARGALILRDGRVASIIHHSR